MRPPSCDESTPPDQGEILLHRDICRAGLVRENRPKPGSCLESRVAIGQFSFLNTWAGAEAIWRGRLGKTNFGQKKSQLQPMIFLHVFEGSHNLASDFATDGLILQLIAGRYHRNGV